MSAPQVPSKRARRCDGLRCSASRTSHHTGLRLGLLGCRVCSRCRRELAQWQQNGAMTLAPVPPIEERLAGMAAAIKQLIPAAEVRLFGSRARGDAGPDSDIDLLITAPDAWLASRDRFALLADLWGAVAQADLSVDLVLHSSSEVARRAQQPGSLVQGAIRDGILLDGSL